MCSMLAEQREYPHAAGPPIGLVLALPTRDPLEGQAPLDCVRQHRLDLKFEVVLSAMISASYSARTWSSGNCT
jgi:hypothetical protein